MVFIALEGASRVAKKSIGAAAVVMNPQGRVLLVKHTYGKLNWELPGGAAEEHESLEGTAVREVLEETGLQVAVARMCSYIYYDPNYDMHHFLFACRLLDDHAAPAVNSPEISDWGYFPVDDLPRPVSDFTVRRIRDALRVHGQPSVIEIGPRVWIE